MANPRKRVPESVPGAFFVDSTCIDCDACRQIAPSAFGEAAEVDAGRGRGNTVQTWLRLAGQPVQAI